MSAPVIDYADVQGTILRGYRVNLARHFILSITDTAKAGQFIAGLVDGTGGLPRITTAARWTGKPDSMLNLAFTAAGLTKLGVTAAQLATFDASFTGGATNAATAALIGDSGDSAPQNWIGGLANGAAVHAILSVWVTQDPAELERVTATLRAAFAGCITELSSFDANALPDNHIHFNYRDNIAQPNVAGAPNRKRETPDDQDPPVATGEFLLGYANESNDVYSVQPEELSKNSSYAAFRILEQDVAGFEAFLAKYAPQAGMDAEMLAAKVCGRWRNGNPTELQPDSPGTSLLPDSQVNNFTYVGSTMETDDTLGIKCPIGSHIRRNNPRNEAVTGGSNSRSHRIVRRAMPYGPPYDPSAPPEPAPPPRGLIGYFINASIFNQFEFLSSQWNQVATFVASAFDPNGAADGDAVYNISGGDIFLGVNDPTLEVEEPGASSFTIAAIGGERGSNNKTIAGYSRMVTTRGGAYVFFPSITGLRYLAALPGDT